MKSGISADNTEIGSKCRLPKGRESQNQSATCVEALAVDTLEGPVFYWAFSIRDRSDNGAGNSFVPQMGQGPSSEVHHEGAGAHRVHAKHEGDDAQHASTQA